MDIKDIYKKFINECEQNISTDSRSVLKNSMFFAWKGEEHDGNKYAQAALDAGCKYAIIDNPEYAVDNRCILVLDSIKTLQELAHYHRKQFNIPVIAIGGSNGKTTTKELISLVLQSEKKVVSSIGSENNHVGVPKTLLRINSDTDIAVVEMGANHRGEISNLCAITQPTHGLITNIGRDHIGFFGGPESILKANLELFEYLHNHKGVIFINKSDKLLIENLPSEIRSIYYGIEGSDGYLLESLFSVPFVSLKWKQFTVTTKLTGEYNIDNIAAAIAIGSYFGIHDRAIVGALESYTPHNNRSELIETQKGNILIKDFYNANRTSMEHALENLAKIKKHYPNKRAVALLGDMFELGEFSREDHQAVVSKAEALDIDMIILVGPDFLNTQHTTHYTYPDTKTALEFLKSYSFDNNIVLMKASNGMHFQSIFESIVW